MTGGITHFKLGLLTLASIAAIVTTLVVFGVHTSRRPTVAYHTYFDESVQGLSTGSPVKFRGVHIGSVDAIRIAPDGRYVDVTYSVDLSAARRLHIDSAAPDLRAQLATQGLTGVKFIDMDFFPNSTPPPLPFPPAERTIAAQRSLLTGLEDTVDVVSQKLPELLTRTTEAMGKLDTILENVERADIPARVGRTIDLASGVVDHAHRVLSRIDEIDLAGSSSRLVKRTLSVLQNVDSAVATARATFEQLGGDTGLVASARDAVRTANKLGQRVIGSTDELDRTLHDVSDAAQALRDLLDELERDPDMLLKGRARSTSP